MPELTRWFETEVLPVWLQGGWLMPGLALLSLVIYYVTLDLWREANRWPVSRLLTLSKDQVTPKNLPEELNHALEGPTPTDNAHAVDALRRRILNRLDRRMAFLAMLTSAAPLTGLLGTVSGLLDTFRGLSAEHGGLAEGAASGLYAALISTQTGLIIAIPAYMALYALRRHRDKWAAAITHVESVALRPLRKEAA